MISVPLTPFAAAVLAGGRSSRLGTNKAFLPWAGQRLLDRQLDLLRTFGPTELVISGRPGIDYAVSGVRVVFDTVADQGPLGGLAAVLEMITTPHVVLVAIDLPAMTAGFLKRLLAQRTACVGVVPRSPTGWEPLAAVYPHEILSLVRAHLKRGERAMHRLVEAGITAGLLVEAPVAAEDSAVFRNVNTPEDAKE
jgi:molybdopterin-guanine dinucleotide biosynthesis protein A